MLFINQSTTIHKSDIIDLSTQNDTILCGSQIIKLTANSNFKKIAWKLLCSYDFYTASLLILGDKKQKIQEANLRSLNNLLQSIEENDSDNQPVLFKDKEALEEINQALQSKTIDPKITKSELYKFLALRQKIKNLVNNIDNTAQAILKQVPQDKTNIRKIDSHSNSAYIQNDLSSASPEHKKVSDNNKIEKSIEQQEQNIKEFRKNKRYEDKKLDEKELEKESVNNKLLKSKIMNEDS